MDFTNPMHPLNPVNPNPAFARINPANVWHTVYTETAPTEPERTVTEYSNGDTPFLACLCLGVFLVFAFVIICYNLNKK